MNGCKERKCNENKNDLEYIDVYGRADAIRDGQLVDVSEMASEAGFRYPVALTRAVFAECVSARNAIHCQNEEDRLWNLLSMTQLVQDWRFASQPVEAVFPFGFSLVVIDDNCRPKALTLKVSCAPGDTVFPVITIMYPDED